MDEAQRQIVAVFVKALTIFSPPVMYADCSVRAAMQMRASVTCGDAAAIDRFADLLKRPDVGAWLTDDLANADLLAIARRGLTAAPASGDDDEWRRVDCALLRYAEQAELLERIGSSVGERLRAAGYVVLLAGGRPSLAALRRRRLQAMGTADGAAQ